MNRIRTGLVTLFAFFAPPLSLVLLIWLSSVLQISLIDVVTGNWNALGFGWESLGQPAPGIVSADGNVDGLFVSTSDKRVFVMGYLGFAQPVWRQLQNTPPFDQPPRLLFACGLLAVDGNQVYAHTDAWRQVIHPLNGVVRGMLYRLGGLFIEGDTQIFYSQDCGKTWQSLWSGDALESNMTATGGDLIVASKGRILAHSFKWDSQGQYQPGEEGWRDISGILAGKPIRFLAAGGNSFIAATQDQVYRYTVIYPLGTWEPFSQGLPARYQVTELNSQGWDISMKTDQGLYLLKTEGTRWSYLWRLGNPVIYGKPVIYLDTMKFAAEDSWERTYVIGENNVWTHKQGGSAYGAVIGVGLLNLILPVLFLGSVILGIILARRTYRRLKTG